MSNNRESTSKSLITKSKSSSGGVKACTHYRLVTKGARESYGLSFRVQKNSPLTSGEFLAPELTGPTLVSARNPRISERKREGRAEEALLCLLLRCLLLRCLLLRCLLLLLSRLVLGSLQRRGRTKELHGPQIHC